jgi:organic radical activating enzyme
MDPKYKKTLVKKMLDKVGPGMCLAKWTQTTIHLGLGHTHSCHHPRTHVIPVDEIKKNPSALHNTEYKKLIRKEMLEGTRPTECNYCWNVEDLNGMDQFSDRVLKSSENWSLPYYDQIIEDGYKKDFNPKYIEISFSNVCNFKCSYCMPSVSSLWMEEIERHGPYPTSMNYNNLDWARKQNKMPILAREYNPYIEAFWQWWPELYKTVDTFRITGGEPLLDKNTYKILDYVIENPNLNLELSINSNLCVPDDLYKKFLSKVEIIQKNKLVKNFIFYTSCEAHGQSAEYIRFGLNYEKWLNNFYLYINTIPRPSLGITATYNALSVTTFDLFLSDVKKLMTDVESKEGGKLYLDIPYLNNPPHQNVKILTEDFVENIDKQISYMMSLKFKNTEIDKLKRTRTMMIEGIQAPSNQNIVNRRDFAIFVDEHDKRRGTNFLETFPEMADFYYLCKKLK